MPSIVGAVMRWLAVISPDAGWDIRVGQLSGINRNTAGDDACCGTDDHLFVQCGGPDELVAVDNENGIVPAVHQVFVGLRDNPADSLGVVAELIRPHPGRGWCARFGAHDRVDHARG